MQVWLKCRSSRSAGLVLPYFGDSKAFIHWSHGRPWLLQLTPPFNLKSERLKYPTTSHYLRALANIDWLCNFAECEADFTMKNSYVTYRALISLTASRGNWEGHSLYHSDPVAKCKCDNVKQKSHPHRSQHQPTHQVGRKSRGHLGEIQL